MTWVGLDIGGANIKIASLDNTTRSVPFPLWRNSAELGNKLSELLVPFTGCKFAVTMTGELADCFASKQHGVKFILRAVTDVVPAESVCVYQTTGALVSCKLATHNWRETAASNWHALAKYAARFLPQQTGFLIDIGSTTTDLVPIRNGTPASNSKTDLQRLQSRELVYTGVTRTPLCTLMDSVRIGGQETSLANELFATTLDAHLMVGNIEPTRYTEWTADGCPATIDCAVRRLARMVCCDEDEIELADVREIAEMAIESQKDLIRRSLETVVKNHPDCGRAFLVSGSGDWLAKQILRASQNLAQVIELSKLESPAVSACGPAFAVATLAHELRS